MRPLAYGATCRQPFRTRADNAEAEILAGRYAYWMLLIVGTIRLPPENLERAQPAMKRMVEASRAETGCLAYSYAEDILDSGLIHVIEAWSDRPSLDRHFASAHIAEWRSCWPSLGIAERNLTLYEGKRLSTI